MLYIAFWLNYQNVKQNFKVWNIYRPQGEGNVFTGVCLSTIGLLANRSLLDLVTARSVRILLECFLVLRIGQRRLPFLTVLGPIAFPTFKVLMTVSLIYPLVYRELFFFLLFCKKHYDLRKRAESYNQTWCKCIPLVEFVHRSRYTKTTCKEYNAT